jgi:hypothetical protein
MSWSLLAVYAGHQVCQQRVDDEQAGVPLRQLLFEDVQVAGDVEGPLAGRVFHGADDVDAGVVGTGDEQARLDGVVLAVLGRPHGASEAASKVLTSRPVLRYIADAAPGIGSVGRPMRRHHGRL